MLCSSQLLGLMWLRTVHGSTALLDVLIGVPIGPFVCAVCLMSG